MNEAKRLPWPSDAVIVVCASPTTYRREEMESVHDGQCCHCDAPIVYDSRAFRRAAEIAGERQVKFFCQPCSHLHDVIGVVEARP